MDINHQLQHIECDIDHRGVARITLTRENKRNSFNQLTIKELINAINVFASHPGCRLLVIQGRGKVFSAGADLDGMQQMANASEAENIADAKLLAQLMAEIDNFPAPTLAIVQGPAYGGALGIICCCDIALLAESAQFCLSEVKLGLIPAVISPYLLRTIGQRHLARYMLTAETIDALTAVTLGIGHFCCATDELNECSEQWIKQLLLNAPKAQQQAKRLLRTIAHQPINSELSSRTAEMLAAIRCDQEAQEGLKAFFEKRPPSWQLNGDKL
jgi:methylglutaconyl-CoA hydratase